ncbi:MAG: chitobiase/beta-hexosaminidase C-terminal domain-containing protein [Muribaculaceae bacterium]|nr:chitobiase/beta-hexosaminidase C-terminal domain-containing protein [Muribaculaceae bacterium]
MKKIYSFLMMALMAGSMAFAEEITVDFAALYGNAKVQPATEVTAGSLTISFAKGNSSTEPAYFVSDDGKTMEMRLYGGSATATAGNTMTITSTANITAISIDGASASKPGTLAELTADVGTISLGADRNATWSGSASSVTITVVRPSSGAGQYRFKTMTVTTGGSGEITVAKPTFSVAAGTYYAPINVEMKCGTAGASIYYTTNGSTPSASSTKYSAPVTISANTTLKAIAVLNGKQSDVAEAVYEFGTATPVANIAAFNKVADGTKVVFQNPVTVLKQYNKNMYVQDASGAMLIYGTLGQTYTLGNVIPAGFTGEKTTYNGMPELSCYETDNFQAASSTVNVEPELIQVNDMGEDLFGHFVQIKGATLGATTSASGAKNLATISDASGEGSAHNGLGYTAADLVYDTPVDVYGIVGAYKPKDAESITFQFLPVKYEATTPEPPVGDGITVAEFYQLADDAEATLKNDLTVIAVAGTSNLYVKDATGCLLVYGSTGKTYSVGDIIPAGAGGVKTTYNNLVEMKSPKNFADKKGTTTVTPEEKALSAINADLVSHLVIVKGVTFSGTNVTDGTTPLATYNKPFGIALPSDDQKYNMTAIVSIFKENIQLLPVEIKSESGGEVETPEVASIDELYGKDKGSTYKITSDLVAIFQSGNYLYVKNEDTYALVYGKLDETFANGDVIKNAEASWTEYNGAKQLTPVASTIVKAGTTSAVQPEEMAFEEISTDMAHMYIIAKGATIYSETDAAGKTTTYINDADQTMPIILFEQFFKDATIIPTETEGKTYTVKGFVGNFKGTLEIFPIEIVDESAPQFEKEDVNQDGKVDVGDVNAVLEAILASNSDAKYDVNNDTKVDVGDVNTILDKILAQ